MIVKHFMESTAITSRLLQAVSVIPLDGFKYFNRVLSRLFLSLQWIRYGTQMYAQLICKNIYMTMTLFLRKINQ